MPLLQVLRGEKATIVKIGSLECLLFKSGQKVIQCKGLFAMKVSKMPIFTAGNHWSVKGKTFGWWYGKTTRPLKIREILSETSKVRGKEPRGDKRTTTHSHRRELR